MMKYRTFNGNLSAAHGKFNIVDIRLAFASGQCI